MIIGFTQLATHNVRTRFNQILRCEFQIKSVVLFCFIFHVDWLKMLHFTAILLIINQSVFFVSKKILTFVAKFYTKWNSQQNK